VLFDVYCAQRYFNGFAIVRAVLLHGFSDRSVSAYQPVRRENEQPNHRTMKINEASKK